MPERWFEGYRLVAGDLLESEGWYYIDQFEVCVDFEVLWRHPEDGISGIYLGGGCGFGDFRAFGPDHLAAMAEDKREDAEYDFAHDGAFFARDLRMHPCATPPTLQRTPRWTLGRRIRGDLDA